jgi:hypothetical protein
LEPNAAEPRPAISLPSWVEPSNPLDPLDQLVRIGHGDGALLDLRCRGRRARVPSAVSSTAPISRQGPRAQHCDRRRLLGDRQELDLLALIGRRFEAVDDKVEGAVPEAGGRQTR